MKDLPRSWAPFIKTLKREAADSTRNHPEVESLRKRLESIEAQELAQALYQVEAMHNYPYLFRSRPGRLQDETQLYFSRGLKYEVENIYWHLAHHLKASSQGSRDLMEEVFELFSETMKFLPKLSPLNSQN